MGLWNGHGDQGQHRFFAHMYWFKHLYDFTKMSSICVTTPSGYATLISGLNGFRGVSGFEKGCYGHRDPLHIQVFPVHSFRVLICS